MSGHYPPSRWSDQLWRSALTLLAVVVLVNLAVGFARPLVAPLLVLAGLAVVFRLIVGFRSRDEW